MKLAVISHTPHYMKGGVPVGWGPTVRELNHLTDIFESITHIAPLHKGDAPGSSMKYSEGGISFVPLKPYGGNSLSEKISVITTAFYNLRKISSAIRDADWVQFRAPTAIGIYVLPYLSLKKLPRRWVKYAGNWKMENAPLTYRFQKWWLEKNFQKSFVTINGKWAGQKSHVLSFENPCFDNSELAAARDIALAKKYDGRLTICFAGTLTENKGADLILEAASLLSSDSSIAKIIFAGDGDSREALEKKARTLKINCEFTGFIGRDELVKVYTESHLILLPSKSEGFPKVIAEAAAYGCVPVVSDISSVGQYFNDDSSYLLKEVTSTEIAAKIESALNDRAALKEKAMRGLDVAKLFTYERYIENLKSRILEQEK